MVDDMLDLNVLTEADKKLLDGAAEYLIAKAAAKPSGDYGDVTYADPGYQSDKKPRYPLNSERRVRSAWSYINMPRNAKKYSSDQLSKIKSKIKAAGKKYGIEYSDDKKATGCLHELAIAARVYNASSGETEQIDAAQEIKQLLLKLLAMEAGEIADEEDEDTWDLQCLINAIQYVQDFISSEDWELCMEEMEDDKDSTMVKAALAEASGSAFNCPSCGTAVKLSRKVKQKLVVASVAEGAETMALTEAELNTIAEVAAAKMFAMFQAAEAAQRTAEETRAGPVDTGDPKLTLRANEDGGNVAEADKRTDEDVRANKDDQTSNPTMSNTELPTLSSDQGAQVAEGAKDTSGKPDPTDSGKIASQPENQAAGTPDGKTEPKDGSSDTSKKPASASDSLTPLPDAPSGGEARTTEDVRANASETAEAYKHPDDHKQDKQMDDDMNPAKGSEQAEADSDSGKGRDPRMAAKKNDNDEDDVASAAAMVAVDGGTFQRTYHLSDPKDLDAWLRSVEANQKRADLQIGLANMHVIPTEAQTANAARRVEGAQASTLGEGAPAANNSDDNALWAKLFSR